MFWLACEPKGQQDMNETFWREKKETMSCGDWTRMSMGQSLAREFHGGRCIGGGAVGRVLQSHRLFGDSGGSGGGPQWTPHFCGALCSVTGPNETPRSCGSALLICGSGCLLGERAATASAASPLQLPAKLLVAYWLRSRIAMFLHVRGCGFRLECRDDLSFLWSPTADSPGWMKSSVK